MEQREAYDPTTTGLDIVSIKKITVLQRQAAEDLIRNIVKQYYQRLENLPVPTKQSVLIDIRGQNIGDEVLDSLYREILGQANSDIDILFKHIRRSIWL